MLATYEGRDRIVSSRELVAELKETDDSVFKIMTGVASLDRILDGVEAGELIVVTGPTGEGKTTLLMTITQNMAEAAVSSVWFTLEVTPRQFLQKIVKSMKGENPEPPLFYLPHSGFDDIDDEYLKAWERKHRRQFEMIDWIEEKIIEAKVKVEADGTKKLKAVFIDHIHMIFSMSRVSNNVSLEIGDMVAKIKDIALTHNLAVFLIAHSKDPENPSSEPRKEDIRDSGLISRFADTIIGIWRIKNSNDGRKNRREAIDEDDNKSKVRVFKNRRNGAQAFFCMYHVDHYLTEDAFAGTEFADVGKDKDIASAVDDAYGSK
jgi:replicative DNA helicase